MNSLTSAERNVIIVLALVSGLIWVAIGYRIGHDAGYLEGRRSRLEAADSAAVALVQCIEALEKADAIIQPSLDALADWEDAP